MRSALIFSVLCLLLLDTAHGGRIEGTVTSSDGSPLIHASVFIESIARGGVTNASGSFMIDNLPKGTYVLTFSMVGYRTERRTVLIERDVQVSTVHVVLAEEIITIGEVLVTATKQVANVDEVPAALSAIPSERLDAMNIRERTDLYSIAPNMLVASSGSHLTDLIAIRGMFPSTPFGATTLFSWDGIPIYGYGMNPVQLYDVERIEVLRGPQGTLYGHSALAGVVHVVPAKPNNTSRLRLELGYGNYAETRLVLGASTPILQDLFMRVAAYRLKRDGFHTNTYLGRNAGGVHHYGGSANLRYFPSEHFDAEFILLLEKLDESIWPYAASPEEALEKPFEFRNDVDSRIRKQNTLAALKLHGKFGATDIFLTGTFQGISALDWRYDADFSEYDVISFEERGPSRVFTTELRAESAQQELPFSWRAGAFVSHEQNDDDYSAVLGEIWAKSNGIPISPIHQRTTGLRRTIDYALFSQVTWRFLPQYRFTLGARIDREEISVDQETRFLYQGGPVPIPFPPFTDVELNNQSLTFSAVNPSASLQYHPTSSTMTYGAISRGFQGGGFNSGANKIIPSYGPEYTWNYEVGVRTRLMADRIRLAVTGFFIDWREQHLLVIGDLSSPLQTITNAGKTTSTGLEVELEAIPVQGLAANWSMGILKAELKEYVYTEEIENETRSFDFSGNDLPLSPQVASRFSIRYGMPIKVLGRSLRFSVVADYQYTDPYYMSHRNLFRSTARHLLGARLGIAHGSVETILWIRNLTDYRYVNTVYEYRGASQSLLGAPRTFGVTLRVTL
jgi:iron complex outermembrane recepter protein